MVFTPAWGGNIPLIKNGALRDWLKAGRAYRRKYETVLENVLATAARPVVKAAVQQFVKTAPGKVMRKRILVVTKGQIDIGTDRGTEDLMKDIREFLKAQQAYADAARKGAPPKGLAKGAPTRGGLARGAPTIGSNPMTENETLIKTLTSPARDTGRRTKDSEEDVLSWLERRYRKGSAAKFMRRRR